MGICFSSSSDSQSHHPSPATAKLVSLTGDLREYTPFVSVAQVLRTESSSSDYFICNSDFLSYNEPIPALRSDALLLPNQLYFLLPNSSLNSTLTAPQMADLAIRASHALQISGGQKKSSSSAITPLRFLEDGDGDDSDYYNLPLLKEPPTMMRAAAGREFRRSRSIKKLQRYASRRARLAVGSFKLRMATIYEGTVL
ncbi:hypothetical protein LINGRAHAP2_LOCUS13512 [Linum grandiflorum]